MTERQDNLEFLFDELLEALRAKVKDPECSPAVFNAAIKLLQNNDITAIAQDDSALADLRDALPDHLWEKTK